MENALIIKKIKVPTHKLFLMLSYVVKCLDWLKASKVVYRGLGLLQSLSMTI